MDEPSVKKAEKGLLDEVFVCSSPAPPRSGAVILPPIQTIDKTHQTSARVPREPQAATFVRQSPGSLPCSGLFANSETVELKAGSQTFVPTAPVFIDESIFSNPNGERKLPVALHLWLHQNCPPGMSIIITWTLEGHASVQLAVRSYSTGFNPFDDALKAAIRDGGLSKAISLPIQQWLARNVRPGLSIICQLFFDGRIGWHYAQGSEQEDYGFQRRRQLGSPTDAFVHAT